jgi:heme oxygenase
MGPPGIAPAASLADNRAMRRSSMRDRLRAETDTLHRRVEAAVGLEQRIADAAHYRALLARLYPFHRAWEQRLSGVDLPPGLAIADRCKSAWLAADLAHLGLDPGSLDAGPEPTLPPLDTMPRLLGGMYVVEGSSLGGQLILRRVSESLGYDAETGARFFTGYGPRTGAMWRAFVAVLDGYDHASPAADEMVAGACATFEAFEAWMTGDSAAA